MKKLFIALLASLLVLVSGCAADGKADIKDRNDVVISALENGIYSRSIASQACDTMVKAKEIEAAFVVCKDAEDEVMISARSNGHINVQTILEKMHGGGHMTAAGLQRKDCNVVDLKNELIIIPAVCEELYLREVKAYQTVIELLLEKMS